jgi:hypothetical protein
MVMVEMARIMVLHGGLVSSSLCLAGGGRVVVVEQGAVTDARACGCLGGSVDMVDRAGHVLSRQHLEGLHVHVPHVG